MLIRGNADLRLPFIASAILLSVVKAIVIVLAAAAVITKITGVNPQSEPDRPLRTRTLLSSISRSQPVAPILLAVESRNSDSPLQAEPPPPYQQVPFIAATDSFEPAGCSLPVDD